MAVRRMIHQEVICCDDFLDMPFEAQALFFQLQIKADDYGFVQSPRSVLRMMNAKKDALEKLIEAGFVIRFHSGVIVMAQWDRANTRRADRPHEVRFPEEFSMLEVDDLGDYHLLETTGFQRDTNGMPMGCIGSSQVRDNPDHVRDNPDQGEKRSMSASGSMPTEDDADADVLRPLSSFLYAHKIKLSTPDTGKLLKDGFDLDTIFWMIEKTEEAHPVNMTSYFNSVWEDKLDKRVKTIEAIRENECDSEQSKKLFDGHVHWWRKAFRDFLQSKT